MAILDALLLDPFKINVWIAYRTDGVNGSGTQNDPYDGSTNFAAEVSVTILTRPGQEATATAGATAPRKASSPRQKWGPSRFFTPDLGAITTPSASAAK